MAAAQSHESHSHGLGGVRLPPTPQNAELLADFVKNEGKVVDETLVKAIEDASRTGETGYGWSHFRYLLVTRFKNVMREFIRKSGPAPSQDGESFEQRYARIKSRLATFPAAPFTLQRICELLVSPDRHYNKTSKFFQAFSKVVAGISTRPKVDWDSALMQVGGPEPMDLVLYEDDALAEVERANEEARRAEEEEKTEAADVSAWTSEAPADSSASAGITPAQSQLQQSLSRLPSIDFKGTELQYGMFPLSGGTFEDDLASATASDATDDHLQMTSFTAATFSNNAHSMSTGPSHSFGYGQGAHEPIHASAHATHLAVSTATATALSSSSPSGAVFASAPLP